jgi:2-dehydropantoate 2-reductase
LRVIVLGAGAIGSLFGALLFRRHDVTLVGRTEHVKAIIERGLSVEGVTRIRSRPRATTIARTLAAPDLLIIAVKAYDTEKALRGALHLLGPRTLVLSIQNGITTLEVLESLVPGDRLIGGWTSNGVTWLGPGRIRHAGMGDTVVGELDRASSHRVRVLAKALSACGMPAKVSSEIRREIWLKGIVNSAINPLTAILGCQNGTLMRDAKVLGVMGRTCDEATAVARAEGHDIGSTEAYQRAVKVAAQTARNRSSMLQDIEAGRRTEIDYLNGAVCALAERHEFETPVNYALWALVKGIEGGLRGDAHIVHRPKSLVHR